MITKAKPYRLLVIEDNPGDFVLLRNYLRHTGLVIEQVEHVENMNDVAGVIRNNDFDIAFLDLTLPDSTGVDSVVALNIFLPQTPIIVLSGLSTVEIATEAIALGAQDYLIKGDFNERLLSKSIQYSIERKKTIRHLQESNERFEFVNKATQDTIWEWDYKAGNGIWGEGLMKTYGYSSNDLLYDESWADRFIHPEDKERVLNTINYNIENNIRNWDCEFRFRCADGSYKEVLDRGYILFDEVIKPGRMIGAITDLSEKKKLEKALVRQQLMQQKLITETTLLAQEKERNELGRELHDNINQILATIKMYLGMAKSGIKTSENLIDKSFGFINHVMEEIRKLSHSLVAPTLGDIGLTSALQELVDDANLVNGLHTRLLVDKVFDEHPIDKNKELMLYRIVQEQMNNISKYAKATEALIHLTIAEEEQVSLLVSDNGHGFDTSQINKGIGLKNIQSRVEFYSGSMVLNSSPGNGCTLKVYIPVTDKTDFI